MKVMKGFIACVFAACLAASASAQGSFGLGTRGSFGIAFGSVFSDDVVESYRVDEVDFLSSFLFGGALSVRVGFEDFPGFDNFPGLYVQPEIGFTRNQISYRWGDMDREEHADDSHAYKTEYRYDTSGQVGYNSIDIPFLVGYEFFLNKGLTVSPFVGFNLSFPFGAMSWSGEEVSCTATSYVDGAESDHHSFSETNGDDGMQVTAKMDFVPGVIVGTGIGYRFGPSMVSGDFRYLIDLSPVRGRVKFRGDSKDFHILRRRGLSFNLGYMFFF